jgi:hypothetical protein
MNMQWGVSKVSENNNNKYRLSISPRNSMKWGKNHFSQSLYFSIIKLLSVNIKHKYQEEISIIQRHLFLSSKVEKSRQFQIFPNIFLNSI